jgi:hypothetical protein
MLTTYIATCRDPETAASDARAALEPVCKIPPVGAFPLRSIRRKAVTMIVAHRLAPFSRAGMPSGSSKIPLVKVVLPDNYFFQT